MRVVRYVITPDHVHLIAAIAVNDGRQGSGRQIAAPTLSLVVGNLKRAVSMRAGFPLWQKSFHDRIIRNEQDYNRIAEYIENNPLTWTNDCFFGGVQP